MKISYDNLARYQVGDVAISYAYAKIGQIGLRRLWKTQPNCGKMRS